MATLYIEVTQMGEQPQILTEQEFFSMSKADVSAVAHPPTKVRDDKVDEWISLRRKFEDLTGTPNVDPEDRADLIKELSAVKAQMRALEL